MVFGLITLAFLPAVLLIPVLNIAANRGRVRYLTLHVVPMIALLAGMLFFNLALWWLSDGAFGGLAFAVFSAVAVSLFATAALFIGIRLGRGVSPLAWFRLKDEEAATRRSERQRRCDGR